MSKLRLSTLLLIASLVTLTSCQSPPAEPTLEIPTEHEDLPLLQEKTVPYAIEPYALGIVFPTRMAWAPDGRLFVAEKSGAIRVVSAVGELQDEPVITLDTNSGGEQGLLGLAIDPDFAENHYIWAYHTWSDPDNTTDDIIHRVVRFVENDGVGTDVQVAWSVVDGFTESTILNGGEIGFGPEDGMLYVSPGSENNILQTVDPSQPQGKILRMTPTIPAEPAPDNPEPTLFSWAYGFRNPYAFTFHPESGVMYSTENGPDCDDEINRILPGRNYGWRIDGLCEDNAPSPEDYPLHYEAPLLYFTPTISPTGIMFYTGDVFPEWHHDMFFCAYNLGRMYRVKLQEDGIHVIGAGTVDTGFSRCAVAITTGPDGNIYFSDIDGIYRVVRTGD